MLIAAFFLHFEFLDAKCAHTKIILHKQKGSFVGKKYIYFNEAIEVETDSDRNAPLSLLQREQHLDEII